MFKSILFTLAFIIPVQQQLGQGSLTPTAQLDECGWFLCKPPVQVAQRDECGWFLCKPPVKVAQRDECGWFLCKPPVKIAQRDECGWFLCKPPVNAVAVTTSIRALV